MRTVPSVGADRTTLVDCRWLGYTGKGRITAFLLEGLYALRPPGRWVLWGPQEVDRFAWPGAETAVVDARPLAWAGQRQSLAAPKADLSLFLHTVRPLSRRRCVVFVYDTIPLRWAPSRYERLGWRAYLQLSMRWSRGSIALSEATARRMRQDLGIIALGTVNPPADAERAATIRRRRAAALPGVAGPMLYVGLGRPQKNLHRAIRAFARSRFAADGGRFVLVGVPKADRFALEAFVGRETGTGSIVAGVEVRGPVSEADLDDLYSGAGFVILASLEEGWGLPVVEALEAGIPVCCSDLAPMTAAAAGRAELFDPLDVDDMAAAIDRTAALAAGGNCPEPAPCPSPTDFAAEVLALLDLAASRRGR